MNGSLLHHKQRNQICSSSSDAATDPPSPAPQSSRHEKIASLMQLSIYQKPSSKVQDIWSSYSSVVFASRRPIPINGSICYGLWPNTVISPRSFFVTATADLIVIISQFYRKRHVQRWHRIGFYDSNTSAASLINSIARRYRINFSAQSSGFGQETGCDFVNLDFFYDIPNRNSTFYFAVAATDVFCYALQSAWMFYNFLHQTGACIDSE